MTGRKIAITGYRLDRKGKLVPCHKHLDVSTRLKMRASKRVRVIRNAT